MTTIRFRPLFVLLPLLIAFSVLPAAFAGSGSAAPDTSDPYTHAYLKWDAGDYIGALEDFLAILEGPDAELYFDDIALLTGEIYRVDELSEDGREPVFSPDNRHLAWRDITGDQPQLIVARITADGVERLHTLQGHSPVFSPDGRHAVFMRTEQTDQMERLQQQLSDAFAARDREAIFRLRDELQIEEARHTRLVLVDLQTGSERLLPVGDRMVRNPVFDDRGTLLFAGAEFGNHSRSDIFSLGLNDDSPRRLTDQAMFAGQPMPIPGSRRILFISSSSSPFPTPPDAERVQTDRPQEIVLFDPGSGVLSRWEGSDPVLSAQGNRLAFLRSHSDQTELLSVDLSTQQRTAVPMARSGAPLQNPALSPDGDKLVYMLREGISWNLHLVHTADGSHEQLSFDIQHELFPHFLNNTTVLAKMGEARHRRSHIYDVASKEFHRLFHNNTVRTVSMENEWIPSPNGQFVLIVAQRGGNTIAPEQGVYLVRVGERISKEALINRLQQNLAEEQNLRSFAGTMFQPIYKEVDAATDEINITRLYNYQKALYDFGSKHMTMPGNQKASAYIYETLQSFGYEPELQWFNPAGDIETANVIARLEGTTHPEVVYILSSHFDSVQRSPGADDNSTGTAVLLEAARVLAANPQPATIIFASLTAEESGLLGAREFVRVADEEGLQAAGVINNDMMGWTRHHRLDNTIRFSNYGIRDVQHAGAILFTDLITYDSRYYRNTDAHVFFDAYGDVIGGIGSYPILGNPNYHQTTDRLETINHNLVREVAKSTTATLMMLANAPSKVTGLNVSAVGEHQADVHWNALPERDIDHYLLHYTDPAGRAQTERVEATSIRLQQADLTHPIEVVGVNQRGIEGWDRTVWEP
ncbi:MAG: M28 family peptidase [Balneolaceae bacterium]